MPQPRSERNPRLLECSLLPPPTSLPLELSPCPPHCSSWSSELGTCCHLSPGCTSSACPHGMLLASPRFANSFKIWNKAVPSLQQFLLLSLPSPNTMAMVPFSIYFKTWKGHSSYPQRITPTSALGFISHSPHLAPQRPPFIDYAPPVALNTSVLSLQISTAKFTSPLPLTK